MSDPAQIDRDLRDYLEKEANLRREDRLNYLKTIFTKHLDLDMLTHVVNAQDLFHIVSTSKQNFTALKLPLYVSGKRLEHGEVLGVAMIDAFVSYLNRMSLVKKLVKFDYRS